MVKNLPAVKSWVQSLDGEGNSPGFLPGEPHGQRSLAGYRVHEGIEMDTTDSFLFSAEIQQFIEFHIPSNGKHCCLIV